MGRTFKFDLGEAVAIAVSSEKGHVIARAEYLNSDPQYLVRYQAADGRGTESWWNEDALQPDRS